MTLLSIPVRAALPEVVLSSASCVPSVFFYLRFRSAHARASLPGVEKEFVNAMYQMGNRMTTGTSFDVAFEEVARSRSSSPFGEFARRTIYRCLTTRQDLATIIANDPELRGCRPWSGTPSSPSRSAPPPTRRRRERWRSTWPNIYPTCARCQSKIREKLQSVVDMMSSTSAIFAPIVLGITGSLFSLVGTVSPGSGSVQNMTLIGGSTWSN